MQEQPAQLRTGTTCIVRMSILQPSDFSRLVLLVVLPESIDGRAQRAHAPAVLALVFAKYANVIMKQKRPPHVVRGKQRSSQAVTGRGLRKLSELPITQIISTGFQFQIHLSFPTCQGPTCG